MTTHPVLPIVFIIGPTFVDKVGTPEAIDSRRTKEELKPYFELTTKEKCDIALGRVGRGSTGILYERGKDYGRKNKYEDRASGSHYFIKVKDKKVIKQLQDLEKEFRKVSLETVSNPSLSIDDIVNVYCEKYVG